MDICCCWHLSPCCCAPMDEWCEIYLMQAEREDRIQLNWFSAKSICNDFLVFLFTSKSLHKVETFHGSYPQSIRMLNEMKVQDHSLWEWLAFTVSAGRKTKTLRTCGLSLLNNRWLKITLSSHLSPHWAWWSHICICLSKKEQSLFV